MRSQEKLIKTTSGPAVLSGKSPPSLQPPSSQPRSFETVNVWENPKHCWNVSAMKLSYSWAANSSGFVCVKADCLAFHRWKSEMVRQKSVEQHQCKASLSWGRIWSSLLWPELWSASQGSKKTSKGTSIDRMLANLVRWNIHVLLQQSIHSSCTEQLCLQQPCHPRQWPTCLSLSSGPFFTDRALVGSQCLPGTKELAWSAIKHP